MPLPLLADFVKETSTTIGTGNITVLGPRNAARTIASAVSVGNTFEYAISHQTLNEWETGLGTLLTSTTFARTTVYASSNAGLHVNFSAGTKNVDLVTPALRLSQFVGPVQIGATSVGNGTLSFSNLNGVSFGLATNTAGGTITASVGAGGGALAASAAGNSISAGTLVFSNSNNVSFGMVGSTVTATATVASSLTAINVSGANGSFDSSRIVFANGNNATFSTVAGGILQVSAAFRVSAGTASANLTNATFSNSNGVSFGLAGSVVTASIASSLTAINIIAAASNENRSGISFQDANNASWGYTAGVINVSAPIRFSAGTSSANLTNLTFSNSNNVSFGLNGSVLTASAAAGGAAGQIALITQTNITGVTNFTDTSLSVGTVSFAQITNADISNVNVFFGASANSLIAVARQQHRAVGTIVNGAVLSFSDTPNVTLGLTHSDAVGLGRVAQLSLSVYAIKFANLSDYGATLGSASTFVGTSLGNQTLRPPQLPTSLSTALSHGNVGWVMAPSASFLNVAWQSYIGSDTIPAQALSVVNSNGVTLGIGTSNVAGIGRVAQLTASVGAGGAAGSISAGTTSVALGQVVFSNSNNVSFGLNGSTVTASVASSLSAINVSAGTTSNNLSALVFSNSNGLSFGLNGSTVTGSYTVPAALAVSAAGASASAGTVVWSNSNNVSFGQAGSTITASASVDATRDIGIVSHIGGQVVSSVSQLAFSNASNVTFSLSTAANAATVIASVAAGGGGGFTRSHCAPWAGNILVDNQWGQNSLVFSPMPIDLPFQFDRFAHPIQVSTAAVTATQTFTIRFGFYTRNVSSLSLLASTSFSGSINVSNTNNSTAWSGLRMVSAAWTSTVTAGDYWMGFVSSTATAGGAFTLRNGMYSQTGISFSGYLGSASNASNQMELGRGFYSATTGALPGSVAFSQIQLAGNGFSAGWRNPALFFVSGTA